MHKIYCFINSRLAADLQMVLALADDGCVLASHCSSDERWAQYDIGISSNRKHEKYNEHFGKNNWQLEWVENPKKHIGVQEAYELYQKITVENQSE